MYTSCQHLIAIANYSFLIFCFTCCKSVADLCNTHMGNARKPLICNGFRALVSQFVSFPLKWARVFLPPLSVFERFRFALKSSFPAIPRSYGFF